MENTIIKLKVYIEDGKTICDCTARDDMTTEMILDILDSFGRSVRTNRHVEIREVRR